MARSSFFFLCALLALAACGHGGATGDEGGPEVQRALLKTSLGDITLELWPRVAPRTVRSFLALADGRGSMVDNRSGRTVEIRKPFYDGLAFHRVIKGFMIQGGCPRGQGTGDAGYMFDDEINGRALGLDQEKVLRGGSPHPWLLIGSVAQWQRDVLLPVAAHLGLDAQRLNADKTLQQQLMTCLENMSLLELYGIRGHKFDDTLASRPPRKYDLAMANSGPNTNGSQFFLNLGDTPHLTGKHTVFGRVVAGAEVLEKIGAVKVAPGDRPVEPVTILSIRSVP